MGVRIDGSEYVVGVCEEHSDDMTPRTVKKLLVEKLRKVKEALEVLSEFGMTGEESSTGLVLASSTARSDAVEVVSEETGSVQAVAEPGKPSPGEELGAEVDVSGRRARKVRRARSIGGKVGGVQIEQHQEVDPTEAVQQEISAGVDAGELPSDAKKVKPVTRVLDVQRIKAGPRTVEIPRETVSNISGKSMTNIVSVDDRVIQERFKRLARESLDGDSFHSFAKSGPDVRDCTLCKGLGAVKDRGKQVQCKKCGGMGLLNV